MFFKLLWGSLAPNQQRICDFLGIFLLTFYNLKKKKMLVTAN